MSYFQITLIYGMLYFVYYKANKDVFIKSMFTAITILLFVVIIALDVRLYGIPIWYGFIDLFDLIGK